MSVLEQKMVTSLTICFQLILINRSFTTSVLYYVHQTEILGINIGDATFNVDDPGYQWRPKGSSPSREEVGTGEE